MLQTSPDVFFLSSHERARVGYAQGHQAPQRTVLALHQSRRRQRLLTTNHVHARWFRVTTAPTSMVRYRSRRARLESLPLHEGIWLRCANSRQSHRTLWRSASQHATACSKKALHGLQVYKKDIAACPSRSQSGNMQTTGDDRGLVTRSEVECELLQIAETKA